MYRINLWLLLTFIFPVTTHAFSVNEFERQEENAEIKQQVEQQSTIRDLMSGQCQQKRKNSRVAVIVHESFDSLGSTKYNMLFNQINSRLQRVGFQTVPQAELQAQINAAVAAERRKYSAKSAALKEQQNSERAKQSAERARQHTEQRRYDAQAQEQLKQKQIKAYLAGDDAESIMAIRVSHTIARAITSSGARNDKKISEIGKQIAGVNRQGERAAAQVQSQMAAGFVLKAHILSRTNFNPVAKVNEVFVNMDFDVVDANGRVVANISGGGDSYAGSDTVSVALDILQRQADLIVAKLYDGICGNNK